MCVDNEHHYVPCKTKKSVPGGNYSGIETLVVEVMICTHCGNRFSTGEYV